jgi:signal transduction histidine kinase
MQSGPPQPSFPLTGALFRPRRKSPMMDKKIRVLILEDVEIDAELITDERNRSGIAFISKRVDTESAFQQEMGSFSPDIILSDYKLPGFNGLSALTTAKERFPDLPFILVSGAIGEEKAIEAIREGATDYVLKNHLNRLAPAVRRALRETREKEARKHAEDALQKSYRQMEQRVKERTAQLASMNEELKKEIEQRKKVEVALQKARDSLEKEVEERTGLWIEANKALLAEIAERKEAERKILSSREQLRVLNAELIRLEEKERQRIATALHDRLGQSLAIAKIKLDAVKDQSREDPVREGLGQVRELIDQSIRDTRSLMAELSPPVLHQFGLTAALESLIDELQEKYRIVIHFECSDLQPLDDEIRALLYRSIRELLMNTIKHAGAGKAKVLLRNDDENVLVDVRDDGAGFDASKVMEHTQAQGGFGLLSIQERIAHFGGNLNVKSVPGKGTLINMAVPRTIKRKRPRS